MVEKNAEDMFKINVKALFILKLMIIRLNYF